jgi:hypothetical protein
MIESNDGKFYAGAISLQARHVGELSAEAIKQNWVIVGDITGVVTTILRWAGFKEWDVEPAQARLPKRILANRSMKYIDVIKLVADAIGYTFYIGDPTSAENSIGVPVFKPSSVISGATPVATVRDEDLLTAISVKHTDEPLAYIIRVRGRTSDDGQRVGRDSTRRIMYTFSPPWRGTQELGYQDTQLAGILKHVIHTNQLFRSMDDCRFGAYYIGLAEALASTQAVIEVPGYPGFELDGQVVLEDLGTGLTTRLYISNRHDVFTAGERGGWKVTLTGALLDTANVQDMVTIINDAIEG